MFNLFFSPVTSRCFPCLLALSVFSRKKTSHSLFYNKKVGECAGNMDGRISRIILSIFAFTVNTNHAATRI